MTIHPEIAKILSTLPAPRRFAARPGSHARRRGRAGPAARGPAAAARRRGRHGRDADPARCRCGSTRRPRPTPTACWCTSTAARSSWAAWTPTTTSRGPWPRRPATRSSPSATGWPPRPPSRPASRTATAVVRWAAEHGDSLGWDGKNLAIAGDSSGGNFVAAVAAKAHDDGFDRDHAPGPVLPVAGPGLRRRPLPLAAGERRGVRAGDGGPEAVQRLLPRQRRGSGRSPRLPDQARGPRRPAAGPDHHGRARPPARRGRALRPAPAGGRRGRDGQPVRRGQPRLRPELLLDPGVLPGLRGDGRLPEREGCAMTEPVAVHPLVSPVGPVRALQLLHRRPGAGHRRHRDRLLARRRHGAGAGGDRPPDRGRPLDPPDPRPHRPHRRRARPVGAHRPARAGRDPRGRRTDAALAPGPRGRVPRRTRRSTWTTPTARRS